MTPDPLLSIYQALAERGVVADELTVEVFFGYWTRYRVHIAGRRLDIEYWSDREDFWMGLALPTQSFILRGELGIDQIVIGLERLGFQPLHHVRYPQRPSGFRNMRISNQTCNDASSELGF